MNGASDYKKIVIQGVSKITRKITKSGPGLTYLKYLKRDIRTTDTYVTNLNRL